MTDKMISAGLVGSLHAMACNYKNEHQWDHLDAEVCSRAAQYIEELEALLREAAQPEQVLDESVRKSWGRFSDALLRGPDVPLPGMIEAFERHYSQDFRDKDWRVEAGTWAAAWKACLATPIPSPADEELRGEAERWRKHAARMAELVQLLRHPNMHFESRRDFQSELGALEESALAAENREGS